MPSLEFYTVYYKTLPFSSEIYRDKPHIYQAVK